MSAFVRPFREEDLPSMMKIWNEVVDAGDAFPQTEELTHASAREFFVRQTSNGVAVDDSGEVLGLYILHPNNVGRCGHIANASFAVAKRSRGRGIGRKLVRHCIAAAAAEGFRILQFNAVVAENTAARRLYESLGFMQLGTIPGGFLLPDGSYADICPYYLPLSGVSGEPL